jgi:hypothetical protein
VSAASEMLDMYEDFMERPPPGGVFKTWSKCNPPPKKTGGARMREHNPCLPRRGGKKNVSLCSSCGCVLGRAHAPGCSVRLANKAKRGSG